MSILCKVTYWLGIVLTQLSILIFTKLEKVYNSEESTNTQVANVILRVKGKAKGVILNDFIIY